MAFIGAQAEETEMEITFLKGRKLLATLDGRPINKETVPAALGALHDQALKELGDGWPLTERRA
eukprot:9715946-Lingulodinium_polyedra.AAC.1